MTSRTRILARCAPTRIFFFDHVVAGLMGPAFVTYHTTLKVDRWPSLAFWAMWAVVLSGLAGHYIATFLRAGVGRLAMSPVRHRLSGRVGRAVLLGAEAVLGRWRWVHVGLTTLMFAVAILHVIVALQYRAGGV